jgi:hypothetical protein
LKDRIHGGGKKTKEQKRQEAEERNARYRAAQEQKEKEDRLGPLKIEEADILKQMADPTTHADPDRIKKLTQRLGQVQKQLHAES